MHRTLWTSRRKRSYSTWNLKNVLNIDHDRTSCVFFVHFNMSAAHCFEPTSSQITGYMNCLPLCFTSKQRTVSNQRQRCIWPSLLCLVCCLWHGASSLVTTKAGATRITLCHWWEIEVMLAGTEEGVELELWLAGLAGGLESWREAGQGSLRWPGNEEGGASLRLPLLGGFALVMFVEMGQVMWQGMCLCHCQEEVASMLQSSSSSRQAQQLLVKTGSWAWVQRLASSCASWERSRVWAALKKTKLFCSLGKSIWRRRGNGGVFSWIDAGRDACSDGAELVFQMLIRNSQVHWLQRT